MLRNLLILLMAIISFSGCTTKTEYIYIKTQCPRIKVLPKVIPINVEVKTIELKDGNFSSCICDDYKDSVFNGITLLRSTENYYTEQLTRYNKEFANESR